VFIVNQTVKTNLLLPYWQHNLNLGVVIPLG